MASKQHPDGYWTEERIMSIAQNYEYKDVFRKKEMTAYNRARQLGILEKVTTHMKERHKKLPSGYWTNERVINEAIKQGSLSNFSKNASGAYHAAKRNGWMKEIRQKIGKRNPMTKEECMKIASKYKLRKRWEKGHKRSYMTAKRNGWLDELTTHMSPVVRYTKTDCIKIAKNYKSRTEFQKGARCIYVYAQRHGLLNEICQHMPRRGSHFSRIIYVFEFRDHYAYVGLTYDIERRKKEHLKESDSPVFQYIQKTKQRYNFKLLTDWLTKDDAAIREGEFIEEYRLNGWKMLNRMPGGGLGSGPILYTKEVCAKEAKKYQYKKDFKEANESMYVVAHRNGWLNEICAHMKKYPSAKLIWTEEKLKEVVKECKSKHNLEEKYPGAYSYLLTHHLIEKYYGYWGRCDIQQWNDNNLWKVVKECKTRTGLLKKYPGAYHHLYRANRLDEFFPPQQAPTYFTLEGAQALIYEKGITSLAQLFKKEHRIYDYARRHGWREQLKFCAKKVPQHYTINGIREYIKTHGITTRTQLNKSSSMIYNYARVHGWLDQLLSPREEPAHHTIEGMRTLIQKLGVTRRTQFYKAAKSAYHYARTRGWLELLFPKNGNKEENKDNKK